MLLDDIHRITMIVVAPMIITIGVIEILFDGPPTRNCISLWGS